MIILAQVRVRPDLDTQIELNQSCLNIRQFPPVLPLELLQNILRN